MTSTRSILKLVLISALLAISLGVAFAEEDESATVDETIDVEEIATDAEMDLVIVDVVYDDEDEYIELMNNGTEAVTFANWTLVVDDMENYPLPEFTLEPGMDVVIHTGMGEDTETDIYLNNDAPVLEDEGTVALVDDAGDVVVELTYPETA